MTASRENELYLGAMFVKMCSSEEALGELMRWRRVWSKKTTTICR